MNTKRIFTLQHPRQLLIMAGALFVVMVMIAAPASAATKQKTGKVDVGAMVQKCRVANSATQKTKVKCSYYKSKSNLIVEDKNYAATGSPNVNATCNGKKLKGAPNGKINLGKSRKVKCTPGEYSFKLENSKEIRDKAARSEEIVIIKAGSSQYVRLGSEK